jgi:hypothetical protein
MSARYEQGCASSTGAVGDVGICCSDLGPETWEAAPGDRCKATVGKGTEPDRAGSRRETAVERLWDLIWRALLRPYLVFT